MESEGIRKNSTLICAPLMADSVEEIVVQMNRAKSSGADLVEIRLDFLKNFNPVEDVQSLIKHCPLPTLFTYRFVIESLPTFVFICQYMINVVCWINEYAQEVALI